ncbi:MAG: hypothetical protein J6P21_02995 [Clostridia bacterium]|nr:hypothetical protein [Clostridia bacterium]
MAVRNNRKIVAAVLGALTAFSSRSLAMNKSGAKPVGDPVNNPDRKIVGKSSDLAKSSKPVYAYQRNNTSNVQEEDNTGLKAFAAFTGAALAYEVFANIAGGPSLSKGIKYVAGIDEKNKHKLGPVVLVNNREYNMFFPKRRNGDNLSSSSSSSSLSSSDFYGPGFPYYPVYDPYYGPYNFGPNYGPNQNLMPPYAPPSDERCLYMNMGRLSNVGLAFNRLVHGFVNIDTDENAETPKAGSLFTSHAGKFSCEAYYKFYAMMAAMAKEKHTGHLSERDPNGIFELLAKMCSLNGPTDGHAYLDVNYGSAGFKDNSFKIVYTIDGQKYEVVISFEQKILAGATPSGDEVLFCVDFRLGESGTERYHVEFRNNNFTVARQYLCGAGVGAAWESSAKTGDGKTPDPNDMPVIKLDYVYSH